VVPRLRIVACATCDSASETSGCTRRTSSEASTSLCRASAPIRTPSSVTVTASSSGSPLMSTSVDGAASRIESSGTSDCPPASTFAPESAASALTASSSEAGRT
jgi:hypothetical protein